MFGKSVLERGFIDGVGFIKKQGFIRQLIRYLVLAVSAVFTRRKIPSGEWSFDAWQMGMLYGPTRSSIPWDTAGHLQGTPKPAAPFSVLNQRNWAGIFLAVGPLASRVESLNDSG
jgi:hypothetical protein